MGKRHKKMSKGFLFVLPSLIFLLLLAVIPAIYVIYLSFTETDIVRSEFVGIKNFVKLFSNDNKFYPYLLHSFEYVAIAISVAFVVALVVALCLNQIRRAGFLRAASLWAWGIPPVIASLMWKWMLNDVNGAINDILTRIGIINSPVPWLSHGFLTMVVLSLVHSWTTIPFIMVILLAGLQGISEEYYEAAMLDGANSIQKFRFITWPLLKPYVQSSLMINSIFAFRTFDIVFTLTRGGPGDTTEMLVTYAYDKAFSFLELGYAASISMVIVIISFGIVVFYNTLLKPEV